jgi:thiol-disulfide isomerase/thioredoxin
MMALAASVALAWTTATIAQQPVKTPADPAKAPEAGAAGPVISVENSAHDFGTTWIGPTLDHSFKITNKGSEPLEIMRVRPSCGCTIAGKYPQKLEPGETGEFPFSINSHKVRGKYEKYVTVMSNDPVNSSVKLTLRGECKRYVDVMPASAYFGQVYGAEQHKRVINVTNNTDEPLELNLDVPPDAKFKYELVETEPGKRFEVHVGLTPEGQEAGSVRSTAVLRTNKNAQAEIKIPTTALIPNRLDVQPASIRIPAPPPGMQTPNPAAKKIVRFTNYGSSPAKVIDASIDDPTVKVEVSEQTTGKRYDVRIDLPTDWAPPDTGRTLTLKTDDKEFPEIKVPITGPRGKRTARPQQKRPVEAMVGRNAPRFDAKTIDDKPLNHETLTGAITVLDFWAPNCGYCKKQIPRVDAMRKKYEDRGVRFVAVSQTMRKKFEDNEIKSKIKEIGFNGELVIDSDNRIGSLFSATGYPTMVIVGKTAKVEAVNVGNLADLEKRMEGQLDALLAGKPVPSFDAATAQKQQRKRRPIEELVGKPAPKFELATYTGEKISNDTLAGSITILDFFSKRCGHCSRQIPRVEEIRKQYADKGVKFIAVGQTAADNSDANDVKAKVDDLGFKGELAVDAGKATSTQFKVRGVPSMVILGKTGTIEAVNVGNMRDLETRMKTQLDALLAGKPVPTIGTTAPPPSQKRRRPAEDMKGKVSPEFSLKTIDDKPVGTADFGNHPATILNFVAPNCGFSRRQVTALEAIRAEYEAKGVRFINVNETFRTPMEPQEALGKWKEAGSSMEFAYDQDNKVGQMFKATSYPTMMVVNKDGKVEHVNIGAKPDIDKILKGQLDAMIEGKSADQPRIQIKKIEPGS